MKQRGFTVIELLIVIVVLAIVGTVFLIQWNNLQATHRDDTRRTAINAMYYDLEDVYYAQNHSYPKTLDSKNLNAMDSVLLSDPEGKKIGDGQSDYRYEPLECTLNACKGYTLRTTLENEADYVKTSRH